MTTDKTLYDFDGDAQPTDQRTLTVCHVREDYDTYGGRHKNGACMGETEPPYRGWLGNPYRVAEYGRDECIQRFEDAFIDHLVEDREFCNAVASLAGQRVACHCRASDQTEPACHLDVVREAILDGIVYRIAHNVHDLPLTDAERDQMAPPEEVL